MAQTLPPVSSLGNPVSSCVPSQGLRQDEYHVPAEQFRETLALEWGESAMTLSGIGKLSYIALIGLWARAVAAIYRKHTCAGHR